MESKKEFLEKGYIEEDEKYEYLTWNGFDFACMEIYKWAKPQNFNGIYAFLRGGSFLGVTLSYLLEIPFLVGEVNITPNTLVVDDIADTGNTLQRLGRPKNKIATIYYKKGSLVVPDKKIFEKTDKFIVYPWERERFEKEGLITKNV